MTDPIIPRADWHRQALHATRTSYTKPAKHIINRIRATEQKKERALHNQQVAPSEFITIKEFCRLSTLSRGGVYNEIKRGNLPAPIKLTANRVAFRRKDYDAWIAKVTGAR